MQKLTIDTGVREYQVNGNGVLRFNPGDINLYNRFFEAVPRIEALGTEMSAKAAALDEAAGPAETRGQDMFALMRDYDVRAKAMLAEVFGPGNDFDALLGGVNLMAVADNGSYVIANLLDALAPIITEGAQRSLDAKADAAARKATANRAQRRAAAKAVGGPRGAAPKE